MQKTNSLKPIHKHVLLTVLVAGIACLWGFVIYPQIALGRVDVPTGLIATPGNGEVTLEWDRPSVASIEAVDPTSYRIYYSSDLNKGEELVVETDGAVFSYIISGLTNDVEYTFTITGVNDGDESEASDPVKSTPTRGRGGEDEERISLSGEPTVNTTATTAVIEWSTTIDGTSLVYYGPTEDFSGNTPRDEVTKTQDHSVEIIGLTSCAGYWFKVVSYDDNENSVESQGGEFKTTGCKGESEIVTYQASKSTTLAGTTVEAKVSGRGLEASVPANLKSGLSEVGVEALKLEKNRVQSEISTPSGKNWVGEAYSLKAFEDEKTELEEDFDVPVEVTIDYTAGDIAGLDINSLTIYHYTDGIGWEALSNCTTDTRAMTVTCSTTSFSIFAIFGSQSNSGTSSGSRSTTASSTTSVATTPPVVNPTIPTLVNKPNTTNQTFEKNLARGEKSVDVKALQMFLNNVGFGLAVTGAGSPGNETDFFGPLTFTALVKFQEKYKDQILTPFGLSVGTGYFGPKTRELVNSMK